MAELTHINEQGRAKMAGDFCADHRRQNQKRRCARRSAGSRCHGSEKDLGDHSDVPSAAVDRGGYSF